MGRVAIVVTVVTAAVLGAVGVARADGGVASATWVHGDASFAPTTTSSGSPLRWAGSCVFLRPHVAGAADVPGALEPAVAAAAQAWEDTTRACGYLRFELEPPEAGEVGYDAVNRIVVREDRWCRPGPPETCYDASAAAITTLFFVDNPGSPNDGVIVDADIEINAVDYAFATCDGQPGGCVSGGTGPLTDVQNVLTHELGHVIGLDHTCWPGAPGEAPLDGDGVPVPPCSPVSALSAEVKDATMYNFAAPEETLKRTPELDDVDGFCVRYPVAADPASCAPVPPPDDPDPDPDPDPPGDGGGCSSSGGAPGSLAIAGLAVALAMRRRRRRS